MANEQNLTAPRFKPGQSGNPGGKTSAQRKAEIENAEKATKIRGQLLDALAEKLDLEGAVADQIRPEILRLLKDSEDRGLGAPEQAIDHSVIGKDDPHERVVIFQLPDNGRD